MGGMSKRGRLMRGRIVTFCPSDWYTVFGSLINHLFSMKKLIGAFALGLMLLPGAAVFANEGGSVGDLEKPVVKVENREGSKMDANGICVSSANKKAQQANQAAKEVYQKALEVAQSKYQSDKQAAKAITDVNQRELALEAAQNTFEDAQVAAQAVLRAARRVASHQQLLDRQACRAKQAQLQACVKTANQKAQDAISAAQGIYKTAVQAAKAKFDADKETALALPAGDARDAAIRNAENAYEDAIVAAQTVLRTARRAAQTQQGTERAACIGVPASAS